MSYKLKPITTKYTYGYGTKHKFNKIHNEQRSLQLKFGGKIRTKRPEIWIYQ